MTLKKHLLSLSVVLACGTSSQAAIIGIDNFDYANGAINGLSGGTNWNTSGGTSTWGSGANQVVSGQLVTGPNHNGSFREYGGNEAASAISTGQIFFRTTVTTGTDISEYFGLSSFNFGEEKIFFGRPSQRVFLGFEESNVNGSVTLTNIAIAQNTTYTFVGVVDYTNSRITMFVNPDGSDFYDASNATHTGDATRGSLTNNQASTQIRFQGGPESGAGFTTSWDSVIVGTSPLDVGLAVPEPSSLLMSLSALGLLFIRRRA